MLKYDSKTNKHSGRIVMKRKILLFISIMITCVGLTACGTSDSESKTEDAADKVEEKDNKPSEKISINNDRFTVKYLKTETIKDQGKPAALVYFTYKNKTDTPQTIHDVLQLECSQNGVECELSALQKTNKYIENTGKNLKDGAELKVCITILLEDQKSDLEIRALDIEKDLENPVAIQTIKIK